MIGRKAKKVEAEMATKGSSNAAEAVAALGVQLDAVAPDPLTLTSGGRSAVIWGVKVEGAAVRVYLDEARSEEAALVIVNPPTLVADPDGEVDSPAGRYRHDSGAALIEVICTHGGYPTNPARVIPQKAAR